MKKTRLSNKTFNKLFVLFSVATLLLGFIVQRPNLITYAETPQEQEQVVHNQPDVPVHDPSVLKVDDTYYVFGTHGAAAKSKDLKVWESIIKNNEVTNHSLFGNIREELKEVFTWAGNSEESHMDAIGLWAPDVIYNKDFLNEDGTKGAYLMYFSLSTGKDDGVNEHYRSLIGLASSQNVEGPYTYVDTVVYSGFTNLDGKGHYSNTDFNDVFPGESPRSGYFHATSGRAMLEIFPNAIDPTIVVGKDGTLHMSYGSWNGGIWLLGLDSETGMPLRPESYQGGKAPGFTDSYFGNHISGGQKRSGEGSYIQYHEASDYYHLYITNGGLTQESDYNVRFFRSKDITGPYVDSNGNNPVTVANVNNREFGNKLLGSFEFLKEHTIRDSADFFGYRVPGHNSVLYGDDGNDYIVFHTRFKDKGEGHALRVHQLFFDKDGWPMVAPQRYNNETIVSDVDLSGTVLLVQQGRDNAKASKLSSSVTFGKDGIISGSHQGTWKMEEKTLTITLGDDVYAGVVLKQSTPLTNWYEDVTFTLQGQSEAVKGLSLLGVKVSSLLGDELLQEAQKELEVGKTSTIKNNLQLPLHFKGTTITWESDKPESLSAKGVATRLEQAVDVVLTATLTYGDLKLSKTFDLTVAALEADDYYLYDFNNNLKDAQGKTQDALVTGDLLTNVGGKESYVEGIVKDDLGKTGTAFHFDGSTGVRFADDLLTTSNYSLSYWVKADVKTGFTPTFFGMADSDNWLSIKPLGFDGNIMAWSGTNWRDVNTTVASQLNQWQLYTVTVDNSLITIYVDGVEVGSLDNLPTLFNESTVGVFGLGTNPFPDAAFKGAIDDLRVYPERTIQSDDVKSYYEEVVSALGTEDIAKGILDALSVPEQTIADIPLVKSVDGVDVVWTSTHLNVIDLNGKVTRPAAGEEDVLVELVASITLDGQVFDKRFEVLVNAEKVKEEKYLFNFDNTLQSKDQSLVGTIIGDKIGLSGGRLEYRKGIVGDALYLDGNTGVELPTDLITSDNYSISMWLNAEDMNHYTSAFFASTSGDKWLSLAPQTGHVGLVDQTLLWANVDGNYSMLPFGKTLSEQTWNHIAFTYNNGVMIVYLNGDAVAENLSFDNVFATGSTGMHLGVNYWDTAYKGLIDEFTILPEGTLSAVEIKTYYESIKNQLTPEEIANALFDSIMLPSETTGNITLNREVNDVSVTWTTSNAQTITTTGFVTRPEIGKPDISVRLSATVVIKGESFSRDYIVVVKAKVATIPSILFDFENTLKDAKSKLEGSVIGDKIGVTGGNLVYKEGIVGMGVYLDGSTGIQLPNNLIQSNKYTVSLWMNPETLTGFTSAFFGAKANNSWVSMLPMSGHDMDAGSAKVWSGEHWYDAALNKQTPVNAWTHMALSVNGGKVDVYFNGQLAFSGVNFADVFSKGKDNIFTIGVNYWDTPFKGTIDELMIVPNDVLGASAIHSYYQNVVSQLSPQEQLENYLKSLVFGVDGEVISNLVLPKQTPQNQAMVWTSSNSSVLTSNGIVTQPSAQQGDQQVRLTVEVNLNGKVIKHHYDLVVKAKVDLSASVLFKFDDTLKAENSKLTGTVIGDKIGLQGGTLKFKEGISGKGVYLDGSTGIQLPNNLIQSNKYTVSLWMNPERLTGFTSAFFGASASSNWVSILPSSGHLGEDGKAKVWSGEQWYDAVLDQHTPLNSWTHMALSVNNGKVDVFFNGKLAFTGVNFADVFSKGKDNLFTIGVNYWDTPFKGTIDELMILPSDAMGANAIASHYNDIVSKLSPEAQLRNYLSGLVFGIDGVISSDLDLPGKTPQNQTMTWSSSNSKFLSDKGVVTRPSAKQGDQKVRLSVVVVVDGKSVTHHYDLIVKALPIEVTNVMYGFEGNLQESSQLDHLNGQATKGFIDQLGGSVSYREGKVGQGVYLNGSSGVRLPDNLIVGNTYSVSMWMKPEALTDFTTAFFGSKNDDSWISFTPKGVAQQAVLWSGTQWYDGLTNMTLSENQWTHVAFTVDNGNVKVYLDGVIRHTGSNFPNIFDEGANQVFGLGVNYWDIPFKGIIDELNIHTKRVMSSQEIYTFYDSTVGSDRFVRNVDRELVYNFDKNIGSATITGNRLDNVGGKVSYQEGVIGEAVYLNGDSGLRLPDNVLSSNTYSMQMWVNPETITPFTSLFFGGTSPSNWVNLPASGIDGKTMFWAGENWYDAMSKTSIPANRWSHLAVSVQNGSVHLYIDGEEMFAGNQFPDTFTSPNSFAGIGVNFWDTPFKGLIDEFTLANNKALSGANVKAYYDKTKPEQEDFERNQEKNHHFKFEDTLKDELNEELEGVVVGDRITSEGGSLQFTEGKEGKAVYLDGQTGILLPEELITSESYSVSLWINPEVISAHSTTFFGAQTEASWLSVVPQSGEFTKGNSMVWSGTDWYDGNLGTQIEVDKWAHIAFSVDKGILNAYLNGEKVFTGEGFPDIFNQSNSIFALGVNYWDVPFVGALDELMVFDSCVLSEEEVAAIAGGEFTLDGDKEVNNKPETKDQASNVPVVALVSGGIAGLGIIAFAIKWYLDRKKVVS